MKVDVVSKTRGFRPFWLALETSVVEIRNFTTGRILCRHKLHEGDGLVLPDRRTRMDFIGRMVPVGSRGALERRSLEIRNLKARLAQPVAPIDLTVVAYL